MTKPVPYSPKDISLLLKKMKASEADGWNRAKKHSCCPGDDWADGYNEAIRDVIKILKDATR